MKSLKEQTTAKIEQSRQANPAFMRGVEDILTQEKIFQQGGNAIAIGQVAPDFELPDPKGNLQLLSDLLVNGPVVVTFYRGSWCPYCNLQLRALQARLSEIHTLGAQLVAISPQFPDGSMTKDDIADMDFTVLSDQDAKVASTYGVAWEVPDFLLKHMREDRKLDLEAINNGNGAVLPIPATFVISRDGVVTWRYVDIDYRTRAEPEDIIIALQKLAK